MINEVLILEGVDSTGKTTLAKILAEKIGGFYYRTPPDCFKERCKEIDKGEIVYSEERLFLYLESVLYASKEIQQLLKNGPAVVDRWIWTTLAYHFSHNSQLYEKWQSDWPNLIVDLLNPRLQVLLLVSNDDIWLERILLRGLSKCDKLLVENPKLRQGVIRLYWELNPSFQPVENSGSIEEGAEKILNLWLESH